MVPVRAMPSMNWRWKTRYRTSIGIIARVDPAIRIGYRVVYCPCMEEMPAERVIMLMLLFTISGHIISL